MRCCMNHQSCRNPTANASHYRRWWLNDGGGTTGTVEGAPPATPICGRASARASPSATAANRTVPPIRECLTAGERNMRASRGGFDRLRAGNVRRTSAPHRASSRPPPTRRGNRRWRRRWRDRGRPHRGPPGCHRAEATDPVVQPLRREPGTVVTDLTTTSPAHAVDHHRDLVTRVPQRVLDQVARWRARSIRRRRARARARDRRDDRGLRSRTGARRSPPPGGRRRRRRRASPAAAGRARPSEDEQAHREAVETVDLLERRVQRSSGLGVDARVSLQPRELELAAGDRDRRAQLVTGVVEERPLVLQRVFDPFEEVVEPTGQLGQLLPRVVGHRQAPAELARRARRDHVGVLDHLLHRSQRGTGQEPPGQRHQDGEQREPDPQRELQPMLCTGGLVERRTTTITTCRVPRTGPARNRACSPRVPAARTNVRDCAPVLGRARPGR